MDGIFIINKEKGHSSHDVVMKMRKILHTKKVGHCGTLDPLATGVLPILVGKATKIEKYLVEHKKKYIAVIQLGEKKSTGDLEGKSIEKMAVDLDKLTEQNIKNIFQKMIGKSEQIPPMYSAIKINGKKLYEYAREGTKIEIPPRKIEIYDLKLLNIDKKNKTIEFEVYCSKGTYIRVLCENIAEKLGTVGYMKELTRTLVGNFNIEDSIKINEIEELNENELESKIINIEKIFENKGKIVLNNYKLKHFLNGVKLTQKMKDGIVCIYNENKEFIGIGIIKDELLKRDVII